VGFGWMKFGGNSYLEKVGWGVFCSVFKAGKGSKKHFF